MKLANLIAAVLFVAAPQAFSQSYKIDSTHTYVSFAFDHLGISTWRGKFGLPQANMGSGVNGVFSFDKTTPSAYIDAMFNVTGVEVGFPELNDILKSDNCLNASEFPTATYQAYASAFEFDNDNNPIAATGTLTFLGKQGQVKLVIDSLNCIDDGKTCGANLSGQFNPIDFGMTNCPALMGKNPVVKLNIQLEGKDVN